jgi:hypothetical protein
LYHGGRRTEKRGGGIPGGETLRQWRIARNQIEAAFHRGAAFAGDDQLARRFAKKYAILVVASGGCLLEAIREELISAEESQTLREVMIQHGYHAPLKRLDESCKRVFLNAKSYDISVLNVMLSTFASLSVNSAKHPCAGDFQRIMQGIPHFVRNDNIGIVFLSRLSPSKLH